MDIAGQIAALALILGTSTLGSLAARAASNEAVRAGSPENEFLMARPLSLTSLVTARGLADAVTDPVGGLFLLPVLIAAALTWTSGVGRVAGHHRHVDAGAGGDLDAGVRGAAGRRALRGACAAARRCGRGCA